MALSIPDIYKARDKIMTEYSISRAEAEKICKTIVDRKAEGDILAAGAGDLSSIPGYAELAGVNLGACNTKMTGSGKTDEKAAEKKSGKREEKTSRKAEGKTEGQTEEKTAGKTTAGEKMESKIQEDLLPDSLADSIQEVIEMYCRANQIDDLKKERQSQWKAICITVGGMLFKKTKILHDSEYERKQKRKKYDFAKLSALADLWQGFCFMYNKVPTIDDFANFAGVSDTFLYGAGSSYKGEDGLASRERSGLLQKLSHIQESGLSGAIVDGRQNPTGCLAYLNHFHNWVTVREVVHTSGNNDRKAAGLPCFSQNTGLLEDNGGE